MVTGEASLSQKEKREENPSGKGSNLQRRILTAILLLIPTIYVAGFSPWYIFLPALIFTIEFCLYEYFNMTVRAGKGVFRILGYAYGGIIPVTQMAEINEVGFGFAPTLGVLAGIFPLLALFKKNGVREYLPTIATTLFGVVYIGLGLSWLVRLRYEDSENGALLILFMLSVIWTGDASAYFIGRSFGRTPLSPEISPKKTLEGAIGGFLGSLVTGALFGVFLMESRSMLTILILAAVISVAGQLGDLAESALKRSSGVKDSSKVLPGHGGFLDRLDSLITAAPFLWFVIMVERLGKW